MNINSKTLKTISLVLILILCGWGSTGHKIVNQNTTLYFPPQMNEFLVWSSTLVQHASDADNRKNSDPTESPKHFIDIDSYAEFVANHRISQNYDSVVAAHGLTFVTNEGTLPWAIIAAYDTLKNCFARRDFNKAVLIAADLGHYVADSHQPLHITKNYNPGGLHSRYESNMLDTYQSQVHCSGGGVQYISNVSDFVFNYIYFNYSYVDSLIIADNAAKAVNSDTRSAAYYQKLWDLTGNFTIALLDSASGRLASLIYTAWTDAGSPLLSGGYLPVEITSFKTNVVGSSVVLNWATAAEQNNLGFDIERSNDGNVFKKIYFVSGKGNSTEENHYSFTDNKTNSGTFYYRLKQIDFNGSFNYSEVIKADIAASPNKFDLNQNYPNPFNPSTTISYQLSAVSKVSLKVYDVLGREVATLVNEVQSPGNYSVQLGNNSNIGLTSGIYFYKLIADNYVQIKKMILLK